VASEGHGKRGKTGETGEEFDLLNNNSILTGLTGLADHTGCHIEWLSRWKKLRDRNS
jgi:hypothetical protein